MSVLNLSIFLDTKNSIRINDTNLPSGGYQNKPYTTFLVKLKFPPILKISLLTMVLILNGNSEIGAQVRSNPSVSGI